MLVALARDRGSNLTSVTLEILARRYGVPFEPSGRKTTPDPDGEEINLSIPLPLMQAIGAVANVRPGRPSIQNEIRRALCAEFGLAFSKPQRARRPRSRAAA